SVELGQLPGAGLVEPLVAGETVVVADSADPVVVGCDAEQFAAFAQRKAPDRDLVLDRLALPLDHRSLAVPECRDGGVGGISIGDSAAGQAGLDVAEDADLQTVVGLLRKFIRAAV